jgi:predicted unusual protein kinase regulating ubiquinone biosynthesis (AarF/ABC1/UbiB family)
MHALGIFHGDLRWGNILVDNSGSKRIRFAFIDNERTKHFSWLPNRYRLKNLVQLNMVQAGLNVSNADRMRFFKSYLAHNQNLIPQREKWIRRILEKTAWRFARKNIRR